MATRKSMNTQFVKNAIKSFGSVAKKTADSLTPNIKEVKEANFSRVSVDYKETSDTTKTKTKDISKAIISNIKNEFKKLDVDEENNTIEMEDENKNKYSFKVDMNIQEGERKKIFQNNYTKNTFINTDVNTKTTMNMVNKSFASITKNTIQGLSSLGSTVEVINRFNNEVDVPFFNDVSTQMTNMKNSLSTFNANLTQFTKTRTSAYSSDASFKELDILLKTEKMFSIQSISDSLKETLTFGGMINKEMIQGMVDMAISNPIGSLLGFGMKALMGKRLTDAISEFDLIPQKLNNKLLFTYKKFQTSDNPLLKMFGVKFGPDASSSKVIKTDNYKKGVVSYDGITRRAIVNVIPSLISNIITAMDPKNYPSPLVYDYNRGQFTTKEAVDKYNEKYNALSGNIKSVDDALKMRKLLKNKKSDMGRFSNEEGFLDETFGIRSSKSSNKDKIKSLTDNFKLPKAGKSNSKFAKIRDRVASTLEKANAKIDKFIFGTQDLDVLTEKALLKAFKIGDDALLEDGSLTGSSLWRSISGNILEPIKNQARILKAEGKSLVTEMIINPLKEGFNSVLDPIKEKFKTDKDKGFLSGIINVANEWAKEHVTTPLMGKINTVRLFFARHLSNSISKLSSFLKNKTTDLQRKKDGAKVDGNLSNLTGGFLGAGSINREVPSKTAAVSDGVTINKKSLLEKSYDNVIQGYKLSGKHVNYIGGYLKASSNNIENFYETMNVNYRNIETMDKNLAGYLISLGVQPDSVDDKVDSLGSRITSMIKTVKDLISNNYNRASEILANFNLVKKAEEAITKLSHAAVKTANKIMDIGTNMVKMGSKITVGIAKVGSAVLVGSAKVLSKISDWLEPTVNKLFTKVLPSIIGTVGNLTEKAIGLSGKVITGVTTTAIKMGSGAIIGSMKLMSGFASLAGKAITRITGRKRAIARDKMYLHGNLMGGQLDSIVQPVEAIKVKKSSNNFEREDLDDRKDRENVEANADAASGLINERISARKSRISKMMKSVVSTGLSLVGSGLTGMATFMLGGTVGEIMASGVTKLKNKFAGTTLGKYAEMNSMKNVTPVYVVGGQLDGGGLGGGDSVVDDVIDAATGGKSSKKTRRKLSKKGKTGLALAGGAALLGGGAYLLNKNKKKKEEQAVVEQQTSQPTPIAQPTPKITKTQEKQMINDAMDKASNTLSGTLLNRDNKKGAQLAGIPNTKVLQNASSKEASNINAIQRIYDTEAKKQATITSVEKAKRENNESRVLSSNTDINMTDKALVGSASAFGDFPDVTPDDMVKRYREYSKTSNIDETTLFNKLNSDEKDMYSAQKGVSAITGKAYEPKQMKEMMEGKKSFKDLASSFIKGSLTGGLIGGVFGVIGNFGKNIINAVFHPIQTAKNLFSAAGNVVNNVKNWFSKLFGGGGSSNNSGGTNMDGTVNNAEWPTGNLKLGDKMAAYALRFMPTGKIKYSQPQREGINNNKDTADCSSFVRHVYMTTYGVDPGANSTAQHTAGQKISNVADLRPGDILWRSGHVGLYVGNGQAIHVGGNPDPNLIPMTSWGSGNQGKFTEGRRVVNPDTMVDGSLKNPNTYLTNLTGNMGSSDSNSNSTAQPTTNNSSNNTTTENNRSASKSAAGDPPLEVLDKETTSSNKGLSASNVKSSKTALAKTAPKPQTTPASSNSIKVANRQSADQEALDMIAKSNIPRKTEMSSEVKPLLKNNLINLNDERSNRALYAKRTRKALYSDDGNSAINVLYEAIVVLLQKLKSNTNKLKDKENILIINKVQNMLDTIEGNESLDIDIIKTINSDIKKIAEGV